MPDARCTRDLMRNVHKKCAHEHTGEAENIRHSLRNGFTAYNALSPVSHVLLPPSTPTSERQDHTSLPYALAARVSRSLRVHRNSPLVVTTADAPLGGTGWEEICHNSNFCKNEIFLIPGLDTRFRKSELICPSCQFAARRLLSNPAFVYAWGRE